VTTDVVVSEVVDGLARFEPVEVRLSARDLATIRRQLPVPSNVRPPSDVEVDDFGVYCMAQRLNPFDRQIYLAYINGRWQPYVGVHGRLTIAFRTGAVVGMEGPFFCHARDGIDRVQPPDWGELWDEAGPPHAAKFVVWRRGMTKAPVGVAPWDLYAYLTASDGTRYMRSGLWKSNPALMLSYKAITRALNLVFPDVLPPDTGREGVDDGGVDESVGYEREPDVAPPDPPRSPPPDRPARSEFIVPNSEQVAELNRLLERLDLYGPERRDERFAAFSRVLGREVTDSREVDRRETARIIDALRAEWYEQGAEEPF
jgi:hypothetical protein